MLATLLDTLRPGGTFMCTLFNAGRVCKLLRDARCRGERVWMGGDPPKRILYLRKTWEGDSGRMESLFGQQLVVFLDTIGEHPEYTVDADLFIERMAQHFDFVEQTGFEEIYQPYRGEMYRRRRRMPALPAEMQEF